MTSQRSLRTLLFVLTAAFALCAQAQDRQPEYELGSGDNIRIQVFQNPDLTLETRVTENGNIRYPLIGVVKIGGMAIASAEQTIAKALRTAASSSSRRSTSCSCRIAATRFLSSGRSTARAAIRWRPSTRESPRWWPLPAALPRHTGTANGIVAAGADVAILTGMRDGKPFRKEIDIPGMFLDNRLDDDIVVAGGDVIYVNRAPIFYIYGEVQRPGSYRIERGMTMRQALAQGGGPTLRGTERRLRLYRRGADGEVEMLGPDLNDLVRPDDVLYVRESLF